MNTIAVITVSPRSGVATAYVDEPNAALRSEKMMAMVWQVVVAILAGLVLVWLATVAVLWWARPSETRLRETLRLLPDVVRLVSRLARDRSLPRGVRVRLWLLLAYLAFPIDLVPDFVPVVGYADDAIVVALTLRSVVRRAGPEALTRHWPGTPEGLAAVQRLAGTAAS
jgi:uncharacterized membrane protein YkvA (DUF1232 family)